MKKLTANDPETKSPDLVAENIARLKALFPELVTEGPDGAAVNVDVLKALVGDKTVTDADEKYGLNWHGKRRARQLALTPSTGTLRPCPEDSVDWDTTQNLMIEGDNLEVLKLLQKSYAGKVKLIYIDPPYNTGKDFVYPDDFKDNIKNYLELTGQVEGGRKISSNTEASGRFHADWLNMMYPRLKLARGLLRSDGVMFVSIDEKEVSRLRAILDEVFGEENFVSNLVWQSRTSISDDQEVSLNHNHTLIYAKRREALEYHGEPLNESEYENPDNDVRGPWKLVPLDANKPGGNTMYPIRNPKTGVDYWPPTGRSWAINPDEYQRLLDDGRIKFGKTDDSAPKKKLYLKERLAAGETRTPSSMLTDAGTTKDGTEECASLMGKKRVFDYPKPTSLISRLIQYGSSAHSESIVMDFFAGSGTTGHATWLRSALDGRPRRFILVQLPEPLDPENKDQKVAAEFCDKLGKPRTIAELTKERLRRAAKKIREEIARGAAENAEKSEGGLFSDPLRASAPPREPDLGFRVFKLDSSNIRAWEPDRADLDQTLLDHVEHIKDGRTEQDILYELLLKLGLDLCVPIETKSIARGAAENTEERDKSAMTSLRASPPPRDPFTVYSIGGGVLLACLATRITREDVEPLAQGIVAWHQELAPAGDTTCVFRDSAFADDVAKTNLAAILEQHGIANVRSL
ncbi:site-specific DNA-methyltransferase [Methylococcus geothermalis]|uniref:site-specific DNA-methyltransferase (adenine-specific) n=1 Tax=Methylococcus geothermalis TaxID=2681310 RepID=A0A858QAH5_9GAMM|nr:site-specific DNA-methyltransferase [Methylococcus geothermalis]QJD30823.1 site-specific DNA-methyltransferase [Methylococcus geothermalis]